MRSFPIFIIFASIGCIFIECMTTETGADTTTVPDTVQSLISDPILNVDEMYHQPTTEPAVSGGCTSCAASNENPESLTPKLSNVGIQK